VSKLIEINLISYQSHEYEKMVELRYSVLRKPLHLSFTKPELEKDEFDILIGGFLNKNLVACCITSKINTDLYKLRQMAVSYEYQGNGFGIELLNFAEQYAISKKAKYMELNARKTAVEFYKKNDYYIVGELFFEVGIEHYKMQKQLD